MDPNVASTTPNVPHGPGIQPPAAQPPVSDPTNIGGISDSRNNPPVAPRNKKEPRKFATPSAATVSSAPPLLLGVSNLPFYTNQHLETNTFIPSALVLFAILAELDSNMSNTYRFLQSAPGWIPLVSQAYIGVCFIVHILRIAREANTISVEQFQFLQWFESVYDFRTLIIPGPLVPVFQALAYTSGPFDWIGNIAPAITNSARPVRKNAYSCSAGARYLLPHVPLIVDQLQWFLDSFNITQDNEAYISENFYSDLFGVPAAANSFGSYAMVSPNARFNVSVSTQQYRAFKAQRSSFGFPPRLAASNSNTYMSWFEYLRFKPVDNSQSTFQWFSTMSATMQRYCQFVNGSVPMSAISLTGLGATSVVWTYTPSTNLRQSPELVAKDSHTVGTGNTVTRSEAHFRAAPPPSLSATGKHFDPELEELAEQFSAATQVNISLSLSEGDEPYPADDTIRVGTVWTLPIIRESPVIDVLPTHGPLIMTHYHCDTRRSAA